MDYVLTFLEGVATFLSPCMLPLIPIYISYLAGGKSGLKSKAIKNSVAFTIGFTTVFIILSLISSFIGYTLGNKIRYLKVLFGIIVILLGLNYLEIIKFEIKNNKKISFEIDNFNFRNSLIFGMLFSISFMPCVGTFLGAALLTISSRQHFLKGILLMLVYSLGISIPFIISAMLIEYLKEIYFKITKIYNIIKKISGVLLIITGIYIMLF